MKITEALEAYLLSSRVREEKPGKDRKFYLSDMGKCLRVRWMKRKGVDSDFELYVHWLLEIGNLSHTWGYKALEAQGLLLQAEDYVRDEHFVGKYDGLIKLDDKRAPFDFKTTGAYKMEKAIKGEDDEENIAQVLSYVVFLQLTHKDIADTGFLVYINKEPSKKSPIPFFQREYHLTNWRKKQLEEDREKLLDYWLKNKVPPCTCPGWMKDYNSYQPLCSASDIQIKKMLDYLKAEKKLVSTKDSLYLLDGANKKEVLKV